MDHIHIDHHGTALTYAARHALEQAGEKWTPMRAAVFAALSNFTIPASAYDIADAVSKNLAKRVAANSIYRILDLFVASNLARRIESANAYLANAHPECQHDCIFLVCDQCGATTHIDNDPLTHAVRQAGAGSGFSVSRPVIELRGLCRDCHTTPATVN
jgi:Fur family transcriptional regulator, zinc uptake regulator